MSVYFNEIDKYPANWLRNLFPDSFVDERSIKDVRLTDTDEYIRCHFFAGVGGWEFALQLAGWPADREVWTGSCPCQPFSQAGKRKGKEDERHLWPDFLRLIEERRPTVIFGEQVASPDGRKWLSGVRSNVEALEYRFGAADLCSASVGSPDIRQRLYWVAYADRKRLSGESVCLRERESRQAGNEDARSGGAGILAHSNIIVAGDRAIQRSGTKLQSGSNEKSADTMGDTDSVQSAAGKVEAGYSMVEAEPGSASAARTSGMDSMGNWFFRPADEQYGFIISPSGIQWPPGTPNDLIYCQDGKIRRIESGALPLGNGLPARMGRLRAYGNAINPWLAARFITAFLMAEQDLLIGNET